MEWAAPGRRGDDLGPRRLPATPGRERGASDQREQLAPERGESAETGFPHAALPEGTPGLAVSRPGQPRYSEAMLRGISLGGLRRMLRLEVQLALEALEAWLLAPRGGHASLVLLSEHADRIGSLYSALCRRVGVMLALLFLRWELKLLRYRGSEAVAPLAFGVCGVGG